MLWSIAYYAQFFDVDTKQVLERCWAAVFPRTPFLDVLGGNPDLYGSYHHLIDFRTLLDLFHYNHHLVLFVDVGGIPCCAAHGYEILLRFHSVDGCCWIDVWICGGYPDYALGRNEMVRL
jgi:hypothetical protein